MSINPIGCKSGLQSSEISSKEEELFSQLPPSVIEKIFSYLNSSDYKQLIDAYALNNKKGLLENIGEGGSVQASIRNNDYNDYIRKIPLEDLLVKENKSLRDYEIIFNALRLSAMSGDIKSLQKILKQEIVPFENFFEYDYRIKQFDWKPLQQAIILAAENNHSSIVEELMTSKWYRDTCKKYRVNEALIQAVMYGSQQCVEKILQHGQISEETLIQAIGVVMGRILLYTSSHYVNIKNLLIKEAKKRNIESSRYDIVELPRKFLAAIQDGLLDQASNIINSSEFDKIDKECLNKVWNIVCEKKYTDIAIQLIQSSKFPQIQLFYYYPEKRAPSFFSENKSVIQALIASERFAKLNSDDLNCIWREANFEVLEELIKCSRFKDIEETALGEALIKAAENSVEALKALVNSPRFQEIDKKDLESALLKSFEKSLL